MSPISKPSRRDVMAAGAVAALAAATGDGAAAEPASATALTLSGVVRERRAASDGGDVGLPGVLVSNGREIVVTDSAGRYTVPIEPGLTIFVIKPAGFAVPRDPVTNIPRFAYVYEPLGTPAELNLRYLGLPPSGPLPDSLDFTLDRTAESKRFDVVLITDPQPESTAEIGFVRDALVASLIGIDAAFGIAAGDLMFDDLSMYERYNAIIGRIGLPWWSVGGNHDLNFEAPDARHARETFKRVFGATYYAHEYADALFIMLDNVDYLGADPSKPGKSGKYRGFVSADQLRFVAALLKHTPLDRLIVLVMHIPLTTYLGPTEPSMTTVNAADLLALLGDRPSVSFAGHTHTTEHHYLGQAEGFAGSSPHHHHVMTAVSGSWWSGPLDHRGIACADSSDGTPNGFHILSIDGTRYTTRYVPASEPGGRQMRIMIDAQPHADDRETFRSLTMADALGSPIRAAQCAGASVLVNVFDGGPNTIVTWTLDDGPPRPMARNSRPDPFIQQVFGRYPDTIKPWVKPMASSHLWVARLPASLGAGTYALKVLAVDAFGREHRDAIVLEVI